MAASVEKKVRERVGYFDLGLMLFFGIFEFSIFVSKFGFLLFELPFSDLPERTDAIAFELKVISFFTFSIEFFTETSDVSFEIFFRHLDRHPSRSSWVFPRRFTSLIGRPSMIAGALGDFFFFFPPFFGA